MPKPKDLWAETNLHLNKISETLVNLLSTHYTTQTVLERISSNLINGFSTTTSSLGTIGVEIDGLSRCLEKMSSAVESSVDNMMKPEMLAAMRDELVRLEIENAKSSATLRAVQQELILLEEENTKLKEQRL